MRGKFGSLTGEHQGFCGDADCRSGLFVQEFGRLSGLRCSGAGTERSCDCKHNNMARIETHAEASEAHTIGRTDIVASSVLSLYISVALPSLATHFQLHQIAPSLIVDQQGRGNSDLRTSVGHN